MKQCFILFYDFYLLFNQLNVTSKFPFFFHSHRYMYCILMRNVETGGREEEQAVNPGAFPSDWFGHGPPCGEEESEYEEPEHGGPATILETALRPTPPTCRHDPSP